MKRLIVACILTALLLSGCAQPAIPQPADPQPADPQPAPTTSQESSDGITDEEAKSIAIAHAGLTADQVTFVKSELDRDDGRKIYDVEFYTSDFKEYDYEIDSDTGDILSFDSDAEYYMPSTNTASPADSQSADGRITEDEAKAIAIAQVPGAALSDIREFETDRDDGRLEYEGTIVYDRMEYEFTIDAETGEIRNWEEESIFD